MMNSYIGGYNQMNQGGYGGYGMGNAAQNNPMEAGAFRNVYGIIGGLQSLLHIFSSLLDLMYFVKTIKSVLVDFLIIVLKKAINFLKYLITLQWVFDSFKKFGSTFNHVTYHSKTFGYIIYFYKILLVVCIIALICLKIWKSMKINKLDSDDEEDKENNELAGGNNNDENEQNYNKKVDNVNPEIRSDSIVNRPENRVTSDERWKNY